MQSSFCLHLIPPSPPPPPPPPPTWNVCWLFSSFYVVNIQEIRMWHSFALKVRHRCFFAGETSLPESVSPRAVWWHLRRQKHHRAGYDPVAAEVGHDHGLWEGTAGFCTRGDGHKHALSADFIQYSMWKLNSAIWWLLRIRWQPRRWSQCQCTIIIIMMHHDWETLNNVDQCYSICITIYKSGI